MERFGLFNGEIQFVRRKSSGQSNKSARLFDVFSSLISNVILQAVIEKCIESELAYNSVLSPKKACEYTFRTKKTEK